MGEASQDGPKYTWEDSQTYIAIAVFLGMWLLIAKKWDYLPVGRTAGSLTGAVFMVLFGVIDSKEADKACELDTMFLLIGLMIILAVLQEHGVTGFFADLLTTGVRDPMVILARVSFLSGISAAFIMNDGSALFLGVVIKEICREFDLPLTPFMIAMATSANIGSAATVLGNPKNMVIHSRAHIGFFPFFVSMAPAAIVGLLLNTLFLHLYFRKDLSAYKIQRSVSSAESVTDSDNEDDNTAAKDSAAMNQRLQFLTRRKSEAYLPNMEPASVSSHVELDNIKASEQTSLLQDSQAVSYQTQEASVELGGEVTIESRATRRRNQPYYILAPKLVDEFAAKLRPLNLADMFVNELSALDADPGGFNYHHAELQKKFSMGQLDTLDLVWGPEGEQDEVSPSPQKITSLSPYLGNKRGVRRRRGRVCRRCHKLCRWLFRNRQEVIVAGIIFAMYILFLLEYNLGWTCLAAAITIILVQRKDPAALWEEVNFELLLYLIALFVTIAGMNTTPAPYVFWNMLAPALSGVVPLWISVSAFCLLVLLLTLVFTSVPTVLLVAPHLHVLPPPLSSFSWLLLAWSVTLCGNLTILSSVAGVIASQQAASVEPITFMVWFRYAFPSTVVILGVGAVVISIQKSLL